MSQWQLSKSFCIIDYTSTLISNLPLPSVVNFTPATLTFTYFSNSETEKITNYDI